MKRLLAILLLASVPAFAADTAAPTSQPKPPTVEDLQKQVDFLNAALVRVQQQRDEYHALLDNMQASVIAKQQADALAAKRVAGIK